MDNITKELEMRKLMDVNLKTYHEKVNNLHDWEKEIKQKEKERKHLPQCEGRPAIRSQMHLQDMRLKSDVYGEVTATTTNNSEIFSPNDTVNINTSSYRQHGKIAVIEGNYNLALEHYSNAIELDDKDPTLYANRALCYLKLEKYEDCIAECGKTLRLAIDGDKIRTKAYYRIMKAYEALGKYDLAVEYCKHLLTIEPNNIEAKDALQRLSSKMVSPEKVSPSGSSESSDTYYSSDYSDNLLKGAVGDNTNTSVPSKNPLQESIYFKNKGNEAIQSKNYELAIKYYTQAIELNPSDPIYYSNRALSYLKLENYHECVRDCIRSIELNTDIDIVLKKAYYRKIIATEKLGEYKIAYEDCDLLLKMNPSNSEAQKAFERIKTILKEQNIENSKSRPWSVFDQNVKEIKFIQKPPHKRSKKPLQRIKITDVDKSTIHLSKTIQNDRQNLNTITKMTKRISNAHVEQMFSEDRPKSSGSGSVDKTSKVNNNNTSIIYNNIYQKLLLSKPPMDLKESPVNVMDVKLPNVIDDDKMKNTKTFDFENIDNKNKLNTIEKSTKSQVNIENLNKTKESKPERSLSLPRNGPEFFSVWSELTMEYKCKYIKLIGDRNSINKVIGASLSDKILFEILTILSNYYIENNLSVIEVLTDLSKNNQMKIIPLFFSETEKKELETLFKYMINRKDDNTVINHLQEIYGVRI